MIVGDWGTTRLRLFRSCSPGADKLVGPGIGQLRSSPAGTLSAMIEPWMDAAKKEGVLLCGMAGSRNGLADVGYADCPADFALWASHAAEVVGLPFRVHIATGLRTRNLSGLADVMRGEETQIFGLFETDPARANGRQIVVLPGTHSKWTVTRDGHLIQFQTFPTGELFALLRDHSTLALAGADQSGRDEGFAMGLVQGAASCMAGLFAARAAQLVDGRSHGWALGYLSGLLIGAEFGEARRLLEPDGIEEIAVVGDPSLSALYRQAGAALSLKTAVYDGDACVMAGLGKLGKRLTETGT